MGGKVFTIGRGTHEQSQHGAAMAVVAPGIDVRQQRGFWRKTVKGVGP